MALVPCEECGSKISDQSRTCPHCGVPIIKKSSLSKSNRIFLRFLWFSISIVGVFMFVDTTHAGDANFIVGVLLFFVGLVLLKTSFNK